MIDLAQAETFIEAVTGSASTVCVFQTADDGPAKRKELIRVFVGSVRQVADVLSKLNKAGAGIWVQINEGRRGARSVTAPRAAFVDDDGKSVLPPLMRLPPSVVVQSSAGERNRHYYWVLRPGEALERFVPTQRQLITCLGTDKSVHNLDRVMRLPGTVNMKREKPEPVTLLHVDPSRRRFTFDELVGAHPVPVEQQKALLTEHAQAETPTEAALAMARRVGRWLSDQDVTFTVTSPVSFRLKCVFNPVHGDKMMIRVQSRGGLWAGCFHDSCGGNVNRWVALKDKIGGWQTGAPFSRGDGVELGARLIADLGASSEEPLVYDLGNLYRYEGAHGLWNVIDRSVQEHLIVGYAGARVGEKGRLRIGAGSLSDAMGCARALSAQQGFFKDAAPGITFSNGFLAATPGGAAFTPHAPEHRQTVGLPHTYDDSAKCPRFERYLEQCFEGDEDAPTKIELLQEFLGACLVGIATRYQKALMLVGEGANGKSVFTSIAFELFPSTTRTAIKPQDWGSDFKLAALAGVRVNVVSETPEAEILSSDTFKAVVTGDTVNARQPYGLAFNYAPVAGHIFSANRLPSTSDHSKGFWRRFLIVQWNQSFEGGKADPNLTAYLIANELPGIAAWAVRGASRLLQRDRFIEPPSAVAALEGWRRDVDPCAMWLEERTRTVKGGAGSTSSELYQDFKEWGRENGYRLMSHASFGRRMKAHGHLSWKSNGIIKYFVELTAPARPHLYLIP